MQVNFFDTAVETFIESLEKSTIAKVLRTVDLLEQFGHELGMPHSRSIGHGLFELRVRGRQEIRMLYAFHDDNAILLHGYVKKSQKIPLREMSITRRKLNALDNI